MSMPAAKQNDMVVGVDTHIIMIPTPGGPVPTPLPHPYMGMLDTGLSTDVKIDGQFAAIVGSVAHGKPPHIPQGGPFQKPPMNDGKVEMGSSTVFINGKPAARLGDPCTTCNDLGMMMHSKIVVPFSTVLIGGSPSPAGSAAKGGGDSSGSSQSGGEGGGGEGEEVQKEHVEFKVQDANGKAVKDAEYELLLPTGEKKTGKTGGDGTVREEEQPQGTAALRLKGLHAPHWGVSYAAAGDEVELNADVAVYEDGTAVKFEIYRENQEGDGDAVKTVSGKSKKGRATGKWKYSFESVDAGRAPRFIFHAVLGNDRAVSPPLIMGDELEATIKDEDGKPLTGQAFTIIGCDGAERKGMTDEKGKLHEKGLAFGKCTLRLQNGVVIREVK